uniref:Glutathione synthetaseic-like n=1 Tax=Rhizophora mucronata TaxID=61149 RepID=A0A2P2LUW1_RHIMU
MGTAAAVQRSAYPPHTPKLSGPKYNQSNQSFNYNSTTNIFKTHFRSQPQLSLNKSYCCWAKKIVPLRCGSGKVSEMEAQEGSAAKPMIDFHGIDEGLVQNMVYDALVWSSLHGLVVGDKNVQKSGEVPGVGMMHAPFSLLPVAFPENHWKLACEVAPICNELVDRVSLDGNFLQESLSRTKKVDDFTSRLLDIHSKMLEINKKEEIRLGLHRSDYMLDGQTKSLLQIELNTISSSFSGLSCLVSELHRSLLKHYGKHLGLDPKQVPVNSATNKFAEALAKAWTEYDDSSAMVMVVVQPEERNMYDQHWLCAILQESYNIRTIRRTLAQIDQEGKLLPDGTLIVGSQAISVVYFRAGYAPTDYPSEAVSTYAHSFIPLIAPQFYRWSASI